MHEDAGQHLDYNTECTSTCTPCSLMQPAHLASLPVNSELWRLYSLLRLVVLIAPASLPSSGASVLSPRVRLRSAACRHSRLCHAARSAPVQVPRASCMHCVTNPSCP